MDQRSAKRHFFFTQNSITKQAVIISILLPFVRTKEECIFILSVYVFLWFGAVAFHIAIFTKSPRIEKII